MNQLVFKFPFKTKYFEQDFYVSSNNFAAYKLIENWPNLPGKWLNVFGASGSGKTHLGKILEKKNKYVKLLDERDINDDTLNNLTDINCLIIDNFQNKTSEKLLYSILNHSNQLEYTAFFYSNSDKFDFNNKTTRKYLENHSRGCIRKQSEISIIEKIEISNKKGLEQNNFIFNIGSPLNAYILKILF